MEHAYCARMSVWDRIRARLFPRAPRPRLENDPRTYLTTDVRVHVDWPDRLRLLVSGRCLVQVTTYTDVLVNDADSVSVFSVEP